jgi:diguanylate cyclase (GGDEF)-like protein
MAPEPLSDVLTEFARTMVTDFPIQNILDHLVKRIVEILPISAAGVTLISPGLDPRFIAASNSDGLAFERLQTWTGEGPCLAAYHSGEAISVPDLEDEDRFPRFAPLASEAGLAAVFAFPLRHGDVSLGALDLYRDTPGALSAESLSAAQTLADVAAAYLLNAQGRADLQDSSERASEAALHDALTGLPNRVLMFERLEHAFRRARRSRTTSALFFLDLNHFKAVNDSYGHRVGDQLLVAVAERLTGMLRPGDTLSRLSGDEFVILCEDLEDAPQADEIAVRINAVMAPPFVLSDIEVSITASIGIAFTGRENEDPAQLLQDADLAMYQTKRQDASRNGFDLRDLHLAEHQAGLQRALPGAAGRGELHLDYQPIVVTADGRLAGVEALLRWTHPIRGLVAPTLLIPLAEQADLMGELGQWVLQQALSDRRQWEDPRAYGLPISVNVSAQQFMHNGFADLVAAALSDSSTDPRLLTLEVTESIFLRDSERALIVLSDLKKIGVSIALDDFGTGYSSLSYLLEYPVDTVKSDRSFIAKLGHDPASHAVMNAVIQLAHGLRMTVVAEGVETAAQHDQLSQLGCNYCQGFHYARPMSASNLTTLIQHQAAGAGPHLPTHATAT